jgi:hypothetical protein
MSGESREESWVPGRQAAAGCRKVGLLCSQDLEIKLQAGLLQVRQPAGLIGNPVRMHPSGRPPLLHTILVNNCCSFHRTPLASPFRQTYIGHRMKTQTTSETCNSCKSWSSENGTTGECRRHAPQLIAFEIDDSTKIESRFPTTGSEDWCGDYQPQ